MAQYARPDSTIVVGNWRDTANGTTLHDDIDEATPDDADWIRSEQIESGTSSRCELGLSDVSAPVAGTRTVRLWARRTSGDQATLNVFLFEGAVEKQSWNEALEYEYTPYEFTVTAGISDYTDLRVKFDVTWVSGTLVRGFVAWWELQIPNVPVGSGNLLLLQEN